MEYVRSYLELFQHLLIQAGIVTEPTETRVQSPEKLSCYLRLLDADHCGASMYRTAGGRYGDKPGAWEYDPANPVKEAPAASTMRIRLQRARKLTRPSGYLSLLP